MISHVLLNILVVLTWGIETLSEALSGKTELEKY